MYNKYLAFLITSISPDQRLANLERWSARATIIIFIGIIAEIAGTFLFPHSGVTTQEKTYYIGCNALIALALLIEYICIIRAITATRQLQMQSDERVATAEARSNEALLELARYKAPRLFTVQQKDDIALKLKQYAATKYDMAISTNDPEILGCLMHIQTILIEAEWEAISWSGLTMVVQSPFGQQIACGLSIGAITIAIPYEQFMTQTDPNCIRLKEAAGVLANELKNVQGMENTSFAPLKENVQNQNTVHILIGRKT